MDRSLREIVSDPDRSLRKLVDLGNLLARGRSQKESFSLLSRVLENEGAPIMIWSAASFRKWTGKN